MAQRDPRAHRPPIWPGRRPRGAVVDVLVDAGHRELAPGCGREHGHAGRAERECGYGHGAGGSAPHAEAEGLVRAAAELERGQRRQRVRDVTGDPGAAGTTIGTAISLLVGSARAGEAGAAARSRRAVGRGGCDALGAWPRGVGYWVGRVEMDGDGVSRWDGRCIALASFAVRARKSLDRGRRRGWTGGSEFAVSMTMTGVVVARTHRRVGAGASVGKARVAGWPAAITGAVHAQAGRREDETGDVYDIPGAGGGTGGPRTRTLGLCLLSFVPFFLQTHSHSQYSHDTDTDTIHPGCCVW